MILWYVPAFVVLRQFAASMNEDHIINPKRVQDHSVKPIQVSGWVIQSISPFLK
jgi:hypothetical protein